MGVLLHYVVHQNLHGIVATRKPPKDILFSDYNQVSFSQAQES